MFSAGVVFNAFLSPCVKQQRCIHKIITVYPQASYLGISNMVVSNRTIGYHGEQLNFKVSEWHQQSYIPLLEHKVPNCSMLHISTWRNVQPFIMWSLIFLRQFLSFPPHYSCKHCAFEVLALHTEAGSPGVHCLILLCGSHGRLAA